MHAWMVVGPNPILEIIRWAKSQIVRTTRKQCARQPAVTLGPECVTILIRIKKSQWHVGRFVEGYGCLCHHIFVYKMNPRLWSKHALRLPIDYSMIIYIKCIVLIFKKKKKGVQNSFTFLLVPFDNWIRARDLFRTPKQNRFIRVLTRAPEPSSFANETHAHLKSFTKKNKEEQKAKWKWDSESAFSNVYLILKKFSMDPQTKH